MLDRHVVVAQSDEEKRKHLFTERYESLLTWALRLTNQQHESAEDLVHDAFVQFMRGRTSLDEIENIDGYLRRMLRNIYVSRLRRSAHRIHETALPVEDSNSNWTAIEPARRLQAAEELYQLCAFACSRKESSKAGSVLILRFFHDYSPIEIARVLHTSRHCVDEWLRLARREAKLFLKKPQRLHFVGVEHYQSKDLESDSDLMFGLRQMIFNSCSGKCLSPQEFEDVYCNANRHALATAKLAHVVSCAKCLDAVSSLWSLQPIAKLYQPEPPPDSSCGGASSGGAAPDELRRVIRIHEREQSTVLFTERSVGP